MSFIASAIRRKPLLAVLCGLLASGLLALQAPASADPRQRLDRIEESRQRVDRQQERLQVQNDDLSDEVATLDAERAEAEGLLAEVEARLTNLDSEIGRVRDEMETAQKKLATLSILLDDIQESLAKNQATFEERAVAAYKSGPTAAMDSLLSAESFSDLLARYAYYESALDADAELIGAIEQLEERTDSRRDLAELQQNIIARNKLALEQQRAEVDRVRAQRAGLLAARQRAVADKRSVLESIQDKQAELDAVERQLEQESTEIQDLLSGTSSGPYPSGSTAPASRGQFVWPAGGPITSPFGYRLHPVLGYSRLHAGVDIGAAYGAPVWAADEGTVTFVGVMSGYGNVVVVDHGGGLATTYNHLSAFFVEEGRRVSRGQQIALVGATGMVTGPHLHFEVRANGTPVDPIPYLQ